MIRRRLLALAPLALLLTGNSPGHDKPHWSYGGEGGPEKWGELSQEFALCKTGHMQSPIDLGAADVMGNFSIKAAYKPGPLTLLNNGHTVQAVIAPGSLLTSGIARYKLLQVHFHTPSEEVLYGLPYPMVAHFVHVDHAGNLAVLGVLFEEGAHNAELEKLIRAAPAHESEAETVKGATSIRASCCPPIWRSIATKVRSPRRPAPRACAGTWRAIGRRRARHRSPRFMPSWGTTPGRSSRSTGVCSSPGSTNQAGANRPRHAPAPPEKRWPC